MIYKQSDAKNIDLIKGYLGTRPVFVAVRDGAEQYEDFYQRAVDQMSDIVFDYDTDREQQGFARHTDLVATLILEDMACDLQRYNALVPDHMVDDPEHVAAIKGYSDYVYARLTGGSETAQ